MRFREFDEAQGNHFFDSMKMTFALTALIGSVLAVIASFIFSRYLITPIKKVIDTTKKISKGDYKTRVEVSSEDEVGELCKAVNKMAEGLEETERLRHELVSNVAHELATPLTNISGYLEAMSDGTIKDEQLTKSTLKLLQDETNRLTLMVNDVRALSSVENPNMQLTQKHYNLNDLINEIVSKMRPKYDKKQINVSVEIPDGIAEILVDKDKFSQIIINLLSNSVAYTPKDGFIRVSASEDGEYISVTVEDTGIGIPKKDLNRIFERFYRTDKSRSRKTGGTGVGLAIVKGLMEAHGGDVFAESEEGKGSKFICKFPKI